jgi:hypothetical protein
MIGQEKAQRTMRESLLPQVSIKRQLLRAIVRSLLRRIDMLSQYMKRRLTQQLQSLMAYDSIQTSDLANNVLDPEHNEE